MVLLSSMMRAEAITGRTGYVDEWLRRPPVRALGLPDRPDAAAGGGRSRRVAEDAEPICTSVA